MIIFTDNKPWETGAFVMPKNIICNYSLYDLLL